MQPVKFISAARAAAECRKVPPPLNRDACNAWREEAKRGSISPFLLPCPARGMCGQTRMMQRQCECDAMRCDAMGYGAARTCNASRPSGKKTWKLTTTRAYAFYSAEKGREDSEGDHSIFRPRSKLRDFKVDQRACRVARSRLKNRGIARVRCREEVKEVDCRRHPLRLLMRIFNKNPTRIIGSI